MALRSDWSTAETPLARGIHVLGDPWVLLVLQEILNGVTRFDEIRDHIGVADSVLARRLKLMVENGLASRQPYDLGIRPRYAYLPTDAGVDALPILRAYAAWGEKHT